MISIRQGTVIAGKQAPSELIPALLSELERLDTNAVQFGATRADDIRRALPQDPGALPSDEAEVVLEDLICALSDCAGDAGVYFGRKHRESSEFGFWRSED
jgi:hypothetical protein